MKAPAAGFSKGVNDALVTASTLVHFKAAGLLGFALTLSGIVVNHKPAAGLAAALHLAGVLVLVGSALFAGAVIYPMKKTRRGGLIFWGDICTHHSAPAYADELGKLETQQDVDREYAFTNYRLSRVLNAKYGLIRWAVSMLLLGAALSGFSRLIE